MRVAMVCIDHEKRTYVRYINGRRYVRTALLDKDQPLSAEEVENFRVADDLIRRDPPEAA